MKIRFPILWLAICATFAANPASAWRYGAQPNGYAQIGIGDVQGPSFAFLNMMAMNSITLGQTDATYPGVLDANGYPNQGTLPYDLTGVMAFPTGDSGYLGQWRVQWAGIGALKIGIGTNASGLTVSCSAGSVTQTTNTTVLSGTNASCLLTFGATHASLNISYPTGFTYTNMAALTMCRYHNVSPPNDDCSLLDGGGYLNPDFVSNLRAIHPKTIRPMDWTGANETANLSIPQYKYRTPVTATTWVGPRWGGPNIWAGQITGSGAYTSNTFTDAPASWPTAGLQAPMPTWQGYFQTTNSSQWPTIAVNGITGTKDLVDYDANYPTITLSGAVAVSDVLNVAFTYPGGTHTYSLTSATTSLNALATAMAAGINGDTTLSSAGITAQSSGAIVTIYSKTSGMSFTTSVTTGSETMTTTTSIAAGSLLTTRPYTFVYDPVIDKVLVHVGGFGPNVPIEARVALANAVNANLWNNFSPFYDDASVISEATYIRNNLNRGAYFEYTNEVWNFSNNQTHWSDARGGWLGFPIGNNEQHHSWYGYRVGQIMSEIYSTWTATRSASSLHRVMANWVNLGDMTNAQAYRLNGQNLVAGTYANFCTMTGGTWSGACSGGSSYNTYPNRPVDQADVLSYATYFQGGVLSFTTFNSPGSYAAADLADCTTPGQWSVGNGGLVCAGNNYALCVGGNSAACTAAYQWVDWDVRQGTKNGVNGSSTFLSFSNTWSGTFSTSGIYTAWDHLAAGYDAGRTTPLTIEPYEGGWQFTYPTAANCTTMGIVNGAMPAFATAAQCSTTLQNLLLAVRNSSYGYNLLLDQFNQVMGQYPNGPLGPTGSATYALNGQLGHSKTPSTFAFQGPITQPNPWEILPGSIYVTPYTQGYNAFGAFVGIAN